MLHVMRSCSTVDPGLNVLKRSGWVIQTGRMIKLYDYRFSEEYIALLLVFTFVMLFFVLAFYVVYSIFLMKIFAKANVPAWKAWVPYVNSWKFLELGGYPGAFCLFALGGFIPYLGILVSLVAAVFLCMAAYQISLKLGKDGAWVVLYIFLSPVWAGIMAFNNAQWNDCLAKPALGPERPPSWPPYGGGTPPTGGYYYHYAEGPAGYGNPAGGYGQPAAYPPQPAGRYPQAAPLPPASMYPPSTPVPPGDYPPSPQ